MIWIDIVDPDNDHFIVRADAPARVEVSLVEGRVVAHAYSSIVTDLEQDPDAVYDGTA